MFRVIVNKLFASDVIRVSNGVRANARYCYEQVIFLTLHYILQTIFSCSTTSAYLNKCFKSKLLEYLSDCLKIPSIFIHNIMNELYVKTGHIVLTNDIEII